MLLAAPEGGSDAVPMDEEAGPPVARFAGDRIELLVMVPTGTLTIKNPSGVDAKKHLPPVVDGLRDLYDFEANEEMGAGGYVLNGKPITQLNSMDLLTRLAHPRPAPARPPRIRASACAPRGRARPTGSARTARGSCRTRASVYRTVPRKARRVPHAVIQLP